MSAIALVLTVGDSARPVRITPVEDHHRWEELPVVTVRAKTEEIVRGLPEPGQLVEVRGRRYAVNDVRVSTLPGNVVRQGDGATPLQRSIANRSIG